MKLIEFTKSFFLHVKLGLENPREYYKPINAWERIILSDDIALQVMKDNMEIIYTISDFLPLYYGLTPRPAKFRGKKVLFYRNRGVGDQIACTALSRFFTEKLGAICYQLSDPNHEDFWFGNPYIQNSPVKFPAAIDSFIRYKGKAPYDYFFALQSVTEWVQEPDQGNFIDHLFCLCGIDPANVEPSYKLPLWGYTDHDLFMYRIWCMKMGLSDDAMENSEKFVDKEQKNLKKYIAIQMSATTKVRTPSVEVMKMMLTRLNEIGIPIICLDNKPLIEELNIHIDTLSNCKKVLDLATIREYAMILCRSAMVVGPDSSAIHFAACAQVPFIGLWGPFDPSSRVSTYKHGYNIYHPELCEHSPCYNFTGTYPVHKCPKGTDTITCECFNGVTSEEIDEIVTLCLKNHKIS